MTDFIGNARALAALQRSLAGDSPPHPYLFTGPGHIGKATLALWLAQALNCERAGGARHDAPLPGDDRQRQTSVVAQHAAPLPPDDAPSQGPAPCGECHACTRIAAGIHSDVQIISVEPNREGDQKTAISVEQVREIQRTVALNPYEGRTRVVIIDPADELTTGAQNAFLKTLEEPPPNVVLVLIATHEDRLLPTILSRCRRLELRPVPAEEIESGLLQAGVDTGQAGLLARLARGRPGWALAMAREPQLLERRREALEQARTLAAMPMAERLDLAERLSEQFKRDRAPVFALLDDWQRWWHDVMLVQAGAAHAVANADMRPQISADAKHYPPAEVRSFVEALWEANEHLASNVQSRLALEALMLQAPRAPAKTA